MATVGFIGKSLAVAQVTTVQVTGTYAAGTTYHIYAGDEPGGNYAEVSVIAAGSKDLTATALAAAITASSHPFFSSMTAVAVTDTVTLTAAYAGYPFTVTSEATGSTGTIDTPDTTTVSAGPHHWDDADNFADGALPTTADTVLVAGGAVDILFGLDQNSDKFADFFHRLSMTGKIGLDKSSFAIGEGVSDNTVQEYRATYLQVKSDDIRIGQKDLESNTIGSSRTKIEVTNTTACTVHVYDTAQVSAESNLPAVRLLASDANVDIKIHGGRAGVGIGVDPPGETVTVGDIWVSPSATGINVSIGSGVTFTNWESYAGNHKLNGVCTAVTTHAGNTECDADLTLPTFTNEGANVIINGAIGTATNLNGGVTDGSLDDTVRTWTATTLAKGATVKQAGATKPTLGSLSLPSDRFTLQCA